MTAVDSGYSDLTKNQAMVFDALTKADGPLSAYAILDQLRGSGFRAPLQVYRALDKLVDLGLVHRLESLNAFVACRHPEWDTHEMAAFAICDVCGGVAELSSEKLARQLRTVAREAQFAPKTSTIELRGVCAACRAA